MVGLELGPGCNHHITWRPPFAFTKCLWERNKCVQNRSCGGHFQMPTVTPTRLSAGARLLCPRSQVRQLVQGSSLLPSGLRRCPQPVRPLRMAQWQQKCWFSAEPTPSRSERESIKRGLSPAQCLKVKLLGDSLWVGYYHTLKRFLKTKVTRSFPGCELRIMPLTEDLQRT